MGAILLVADDDPDLRLYVRRCVLDDAGPIDRVIEAADGGAALDLIRSQIPDVLVCDVVMPRVGGIEVCERLRADPKTAEIPVLLFTGNAMSRETIRRAREVGADEVLLKPFNSRRLCTAIAEVMRTRGAGWARHSEREIELESPNDEPHKPETRERPS